MRTRHAGFETHKIDETTPRHSTRGPGIPGIALMAETLAIQHERTRHSRHCADGRNTGLFAGDAQTMCILCADLCADDAQTMLRRCAHYAQPIHRLQRKHTDRTLGCRGRSARKSDPRRGNALRGNQTRGRSEEADVPVELRQCAGRRVSAQTWTQEGREHGGHEHGRAWRR